MMAYKAKQMVGWVFAGVVFGAVAPWVALAAAGGGHGTYIPAVILFPFTMLLASVVGVISTPLIALALLQYPAYGLLIATRENARRTMVGIASAHIAVVMAALFANLRSGVFIQSVYSTVTDLARLRG